MSSYAIKTHLLTKQFKDNIVVNGLSIHVPLGSIFGFLGPNGAGKTTTMRLLLGLIRPTSGGGRILDYDISKEKSLWAPLVGSIIEEPVFYSYLSCEENLKIFALYSGLSVDKWRLEAALEQVGLVKRRKDSVRTFSQGMKRRLGIASALISKPKLIILDEPTNGLDPAGTLDIRKLVGQLAEDGATVLISSHLLSEVQQMCTHVAIVDKGNLKFQGDINQLLQQNSNVIIEAEPIDKVVRICQEKLYLQVEVINSKTVQIAMDATNTPSLIKELATADISIYQVFRKSASLEDVFFDVLDKTPVE